MGRKGQRAAHTGKAGVAAANRERGVDGGGQEAAHRVSRRIVQDVFGPAGERRVAVRYWDGSQEKASATDPPLVVQLNGPGSLRRAFLPPTEAAMGRAYVEGAIDLEGDLEEVVDLAEVARQRLGTLPVLARATARLLRLPRGAERDETGPPVALRGRRHSISRDSAAVRSHYDVGNDFFGLFLDRRLVYSCGYYPDGVDDLDSAQERKLDHICRKLRLSRAERFLDVGCGWGALVMHAAERYGVEALGVALSEPQASLARERIVAAGLADRCRIEVRDYRDLPGTGPFDKIASIGMVEHVGADRLPEYFGAIKDVLRPGGLFLNHGIVSLRRARERRSPPGIGRGPRSSFIQRYVFPDGELLTVAENIAPGEAVGLELRDIESLREHYARTLRSWVRRLEDRERDAIGLVEAETFRVWRLHLAASARLSRVESWGLLRPSGPGRGRTAPSRSLRTGRTCTGAVRRRDANRGTPGRLEVRRSRNVTGLPRRGEGERGAGDHEPGLTALSRSLHPRAATHPATMDVHERRSQCQGPWKPPGSR